PLRMWLSHNFGRVRRPRGTYSSSKVSISASLNLINIGIDVKCLTRTTTLVSKSSWAGSPWFSNATGIAQYHFESALSRSSAIRKQTINTVPAPVMATKSTASHITRLQGTALSLTHQFTTEGVREL